MCFKACLQAVAFSMNRVISRGSLRVISRLFTVVLVVHLVLFLQLFALVFVHPIKHKPCYPPTPLGVLALRRFYTSFETKTDPLL